MPKDIKCYPIISFVDIKYLGKFEQMIPLLGYFKDFLKNGPILASFVYVHLFYMTQITYKLIKG